jgi:lambda repressor-like predicted transcriptional regulator
VYYLTKEDYATAKANGISHGMLYNRYYRLDYDLDRAVTEPPGSYKRITPNMKEWERWKHVAETNGITRQMFFNRLNSTTMKDWTPEEAATVPKGQKRGTTLTPELYALAEKNGISKVTLRNRIFGQHWRPYRAATEPVDKNRINGRYVHTVVYDEEMFV